MVTIDVRKLISFGKGSYIISMPKAWVEKNKLKKGDLISIDDDGYELVIKAGNNDRKPESREITIDCNGKGLELIKTEIVSSYLNGYDTVNIIFEPNDKQIPRIKNTIRNLSGLEIMEQTSTRIIAKNLVNISEISIEGIIRRMDTIARAMMEDTLLCVKNETAFENIHSRDLDVNRLYFLGSRVIHHALKNPRVVKSLSTDVWKLHNNGFMILRIEKIADRQKRISRYLCTNSFDRETISQLDSIHRQLIDAYKDVMKSYYNKDKDLAYDIEVSNKERIQKCNTLLENYNKIHFKLDSKMSSSLVAVARIVENLKAMSAETRNIARVVLSFD